MQLTLTCRVLGMAVLDDDVLAVAPLLGDRWEASLLSMSRTIYDWT
jgi:hypothetical protein